MRLHCSTAAVITLLLLELARAKLVTEAELVADIRTSILSLTSQTRRQRSENNREKQHNTTICYLASSRALSFLNVEALQGDVKLGHGRFG